MTPTYNDENFLGEAIESVLRQTYPKIEIIVVDDGSTAAEKSMEKFGDKINFIRQPHSGLPAVGRNRGIKEASGQYIAFLDSDDRWKPEKLTDQVTVLETNPDFGLCCSNAYRCPEGIENQEFDLFLRPNQGVSGYVLTKLLENNFIITSTVVVRKDLLESTGFFDETPKLRAIEDYCLWLRFAALAKISYLPEPLAIYQDRINSIRAKNSMVFYQQGMIYMLENFRRFLQQQEKLDKKTKRQINRMIFQNHRQLLKTYLVSSQPTEALKYWLRLVAETRHPDS